MTAADAMRAGDTEYDRDATSLSVHASGTPNWRRPTGPPTRSFGLRKAATARMASCAAADSTSGRPAVIRHANRDRPATSWAGLSQPGPNASTAHTTAG